MLEMKNICKSFDGKTVLQDISFAIPPRQLTALLGANGSGKTTIFRLLLGLMKPDSGTISFNGQEVSCGLMGYVPEERSLFTDCTVDTMLTLMGQLHGMEPDLLQMRLQQGLNELDLTEYRYRTIRTLSKGNQQKVQLLAAIIAQPPVLILDEPFNGLDPSHVVQLCQIMRRYAQKGKTVILSYHQYGQLNDLADDYIYLKDGKINFQISQQKLDEGNQRIVSVLAESSPVIDEKNYLDVYSFNRQKRYRVENQNQAESLANLIRRQLPKATISIGPLQFYDLFKEQAE